MRPLFFAGTVRFSQVSEQVNNAVRARPKNRRIGNQGMISAKMGKRLSAQLAIRQAQSMVVLVPSQLNIRGMKGAMINMDETPIAADRPLMDFEAPIHSNRKDKSGMVMPNRQPMRSTEI